MTKYLQADIKIVFNLSDIWHTEVGAVLLLKDAFVVSLPLLTLWRGEEQMLMFYLHLLESLLPVGGFGPLSAFSISSELDVLR